MKKIIKTTARTVAETNNAFNEKMYDAAISSTSEIMRKYETPSSGLTEEQAEASREKYGENILTYGKKNSVLKRLLSAFVNPFTVILLALAVISVFTDVILAAPEDKNYATVIIITVMVAISGNRDHNGNNNDCRGVFILWRR